MHPRLMAPITRVAIAFAVFLLAGAVPGGAADGFTLGDEVVLEGFNTESDTTYLFVTGPNIPVEGGRLDHPQTAVIDGDPESFTRTGVETDGRWRYRWQTRGIGLDAGVYVVYAESRPRSRTNLVHGEYSTQSYSFGRSSRITITTTTLPTETAATTAATTATTSPAAKPATATTTRAPGFALIAAITSLGVAALLPWRCKDA